MNTNTEILDLAKIQVRKNHQRIEEALAIVTSLSRENGRIIEMSRKIEGDNNDCIGSFLHDLCLSENYLKTIDGELVWVSREQAAVLRGSDSRDMLLPIANDDWEILRLIRNGELKVINASPVSSPPKSNGKRKALGRGLAAIEGRK